MFNAPLLRDWVRDVKSRPGPSWLIEDFIVADGAIQVTGPATRGMKSWFLFQLGLCAASGQSASLIKPNGISPTLIVEAESPAKPTANRFDKLERGCGIKAADLNNFWFAHRVPFILDRRQDVDNLIAFVKYNGVKLVGFDTYAKVTSGNENAVEDVSRVMRHIDLIRNAGAAVIWVHHTGKPSEYRTDIDDEGRGSTALAGAYDVHIALRRRTEGQKHLDCTVRSNEAEEKYFTMNWYIDNREDIAVLSMERQDDRRELPNKLKDECVNRLVTKRYYKLTDLATLWELKREQAKDMIAALMSENTLADAGSRGYYLNFGGGGPT